ncbi:MAG: YIP1 family protein, partial [Acutalibacteraceae bacterium]
KRSRIFVYNKESEMLYAFGGPGAYSGGLSVASAMEYKDGRFYITDSSKNAVCVFELTEYGRLFGSIAKAREEIDFESEAALWNEVMARNENCLLAVKGLGDAAYKKHDMRLAMQYYKKAGDREDYSKAYTFVRREWIESNAYIILLAVAVVIIAASLVGRAHKRKLAVSDKNSFISREHFSSYVCFHPLDGFWDLKREERGTVGIAFFWFAATAVALVANSLCVGFIFNTTNLDTYNMLGNIAFVTVALLLWCIAQWCVTSLMDGEGKFKDIFIATCYALRPYCILSVAGIALSNVLSQTEGDFYYVLTALALLWTAVLLVAGLMQTHNYSLGKTVLVIVIILVVILLITFIGMLVFALCQQLTAFIKDLINEVQLRV